MHFQYTVSRCRHRDNRIVTALPLDRSRGRSEIISMKYGYYTGCSVTTIEQELDISLRGILGRMSVNLEVFENSGCCGTIVEGSTPVDPAREMLLNEIIRLTRGLDALIVPCPNCYRTIRSVLVGSGEELPRVLHPLEFLTGETTLDMMQSMRTRSFNDLKVSAYYGCVFKPMCEEEEGREVPRYMEKIFDALGLETIWFPESDECCGGHQHMDSIDAWGPVSKRIVDAASRWGADVIAVACPQCHSLLEGSMQSDRIVGEDEVVVLYYSQIAGYILGLDRQSLFPSGENNPLVNRM